MLVLPNHLPATRGKASGRNLDFRIRAVILDSMKRRLREPIRVAQLHVQLAALDLCLQEAASIYVRSVGRRLNAVLDAHGYAGVERKALDELLGYACRGRVAVKQGGRISLHPQRCRRPVSLRGSRATCISGKRLAAVSAAISLVGCSTIGHSNVQQYPSAEVSYWGSTPEVSKFELSSETVYRECDPGVCAPINPQSVPRAVPDAATSQPEIPVRYGDETTYPELARDPGSMSHATMDRLAEVSVPTNGKDATSPRLTVRPAARTTRRPSFDALAATSWPYRNLGVELGAVGAGTVNRQPTVQFTTYGSRTPSNVAEAPPSKVFFRMGGTKIEGDAVAEMANLAATLPPNASITITGRSCPIGNVWENVRIERARAMAVASGLRILGRADLRIRLDEAAVVRGRNEPPVGQFASLRRVDIRVDSVPESPMPMVTRLGTIAKGLIAPRLRGNQPQAQWSVDPAATATLLGQGDITQTAFRLPHGGGFYAGHESVFFRTGSAKASRDALQRICDLALEAPKNATIVIIGRTSPTGSVRLNELLARHRAIVVATALQAVHRRDIKVRVLARIFTATGRQDGDADFALLRRADVAVIPASVSGTPM